MSVEGLDQVELKPQQLVGVIAIHADVLLGHVLVALAQKAQPNPCEAAACGDWPPIAPSLHINMDHRVKPGGDEERDDQEKGTEVPREMIAALAIATASGRRGRIAGRSANRGARSARRTSSRPQARDRARAMRRWPGKVEREAAHADRRDHATLSAYSAPLTPHTVAKWHATATFLRHPPGAGRLAAGLPLSYASIEI